MHPAGIPSSSQTVNSQESLCCFYVECRKKTAKDDASAVEAGTAVLLQLGPKIQRLNGLT